MSGLTLAQRALLLRVALVGSLVHSDLTEFERDYADWLVTVGVLRDITVVGVASRHPLLLRRVVTYVCTPLGMQVAALLH